MRTLIWSAQITLDGVYEGPGDESQRLDWHRADDEWGEYSIELLGASDTYLFGRTTYEGFAAFWPAQEGEVARLLNVTPKVVCSTTLPAATWEPSRLVRGGVPGAVRDLKAAPGGAILVLGSATLAATLMRHNLIDEYRVAVNPVVLGAGTPLFKGGDYRNLRLTDTRTFRSGIVELHYVPDDDAGA